MKSDLRKTAMAASLGVACLMLAGKVTAYFLTGSVAILSDAAESVIHIVATVGAAWSLWFSRQAPCEKHPYGHGKIAYFSAGFEGALIMAASLFIVGAGVRELVIGPDLHQLSLGLLLTLSLGLVNLALGLFLVYVGKRRNAIILVANGKHVLTDMWTSMGVVVGVGLVWLTDINWLDPVVAIALGLHILREAASLIWRSFGGLLDEADADKTKALLACLDQAVADKQIEAYHQLRHRQSDNVMWVEVHMLLPGGLPMAQAHKRVTEVEERLRALFPEFEVTITSHLEPSSHISAHPQGHPGPTDPYAER